MEIDKVVIAQKSSIELIEPSGINFGDLIQVEFKGSTYYFKVSEVIANKNTELIHITAEQTGSSSYKLSNRLKGRDIPDFCDQEYTEISIVTDHSVINGVRQASCLC